MKASKVAFMLSRDNVKFFGGLRLSMGTAEVEKRRNQFRLELRMTKESTPRKKSRKIIISNTNFPAILEVGHEHALFDIVLLSYRGQSKKAYLVQQG